MDREYSQIIVNRILSLCKGPGISINKLADMSNVSQSTLDNFINGKTFNPRIKTLHKIALAFGLTPAEFFNFEEFNKYSFDEKANDENDEE